MAYYSDVTAAIAEMRRWHCAVLAVACAETVSPVVMRFGQSKTRVAFQEGLTVCWKSVANENVDSLVRSLSESLGELPESTCDDSNLSDYEVMIAVSILADALSAVLEDDNGRATRDACTGAVNWFSGCDVVLSQDTQPKIIDPRNPLPPERLESLQIDFQFRTIKQLASVKHARDNSIEQIRSSAQELAADVNGVLPTIADRRGWDIDV
jgi:hypothetical protein